jgi:hypothetical protein
VKRKQLHLWLCESDHAFLIRQAAERDEAIGAVVRRLIRSWRQSLGPSPTAAASARDLRDRHADVVHGSMTAMDGERRSGTRTN